MREVLDHFQKNAITANHGSEVFQAFLVAPWFETLLFIYLPFQLYLRVGFFWEIGLISATIFTLIHIRFGKFFIPYTFFGGLLFWTIMSQYGPLLVIAIHLAANVLDLSFGWRKTLKKWSDRRISSP